MPKPDKPPGEGPTWGGGDGPPGQSKGLNAVATLHEARDICAVTASYPNAATIAGSERADICALVGKPTGKAVLPIVESRDTALITGSLPLLLQAQIHATEQADGVAVAAQTPVAQVNDDFAYRSSAPGVFRVFSFDTAIQLGVNQTNGQPLGNTPTTSYGYAAGSPNGGTPSIDLVRGALCLTVPPFSGNDCGGKWQTKFNDDGTLVFRENCEFYAQFAFTHDGLYSMDSPAIDGSWPAPGYGPKFAYFGGINVGSTSEFYIVVYPTLTDLGMPFAYTYIPVWGTYGFAPFNNVTGQYNLQNACPYPFRSHQPPYDIVPGCVQIPANTKVYFQLGVQLREFTTGTDPNGGTYPATNVSAQIWMTINGVTTKVVDWGPSSPGYYPMMRDPALTPTSGNGFSRMLFDSYITGKNQTINHPTYHQYYDELILSTQRIPDPVVYPTWRQGKTVGSWFELKTPLITQNTAQLGNVIDAAAASNASPPSYAVGVWCGFAKTSTGWISTLSSGHSIPFNTAFKINLMQNSPQWVLLNAGVSGGNEYATNSPWTQANRFRYYQDGTPTSRHTYFSQQWISAAHDSQGKERAMCFGTFATYANDLFNAGFPDTYAGGPDIESYNVTDGHYDTNKWPNFQVFANAYSWGAAGSGFWASSAKHPTTEDVYFASSYMFFRFNAATGTVDYLQGRYDSDLTPPVVPLNPAQSRYVQWQDCPSLIDAGRNRFVCLTDGYALEDGPPRLEIFDLATNTNTGPLVISGDLTYAKMTWSYPGFTGRCTGGCLMHDTDRDLYIAFISPSGFSSTGQTGTAGTNPVNIFEINPTTGASVQVGTAPATSVSTNNVTFGMYQRATYFSELGGIAYLPNFDSNVWFYPTR